MDSEYRLRMRSIGRDTRHVKHCPLLLTGKEQSAKNSEYSLGTCEVGKYHISLLLDIINNQSRSVGI